MRRIGFWLTMGLMLAGCLPILIPLPVFAIDASSYFNITYTTILNKQEIHGGDTISAVVTGKAVCSKDLPLSVSEGYVKGRLRARNEATGTTIDLGSDYTVTINPFPQKQGDSSEQSMSILLNFPQGVQPGQYVIYGELIEARVKAILWFTVTSYLPSTQELARITILPIGGPTNPPPLVPTTSAASIGTTSTAGHIDPQGLITDEIVAVSEDGNCSIKLAKGVKALDRYGFPLTEIQITTIKDPPGLPSDTDLISPVYSVTPAGATFRPEVYLVMNFDPSQLSALVNQDNLIVIWWNADATSWVKIEDGTIDATKHTISAAISHFSLYAIAIQNPLLQPLTAGQSVAVTNPTQTQAVETAPTSKLSDIILPEQAISSQSALPNITASVDENNAAKVYDDQHLKSGDGSSQWWLAGLIFGVNIFLLIIVLRLLKNRKT